MLTSKIELFHFGDCGQYDELNPFYIFAKENTPEILFLIAHSEPFELKANDIAKLLDCELKDLENILNAMEKIHMVLVKNDRYSINFPVFLEKDLHLLDKFSKKTAQKIGDLVIMNKEKLHQLVSKLSAHKYFSYERLLYHIIGDYIFDGTAIEYFGTREIFKISKEQLGHRDYILIGFEESEKMFDFSDNILCSSNNYKVKNIRFNSFGDGNGNREDLYRFFRQVNSSLKNATDNDKLNLSYIKLIEQQNQMLGENCAILIKRVLNEDICISDLSPMERKRFDFLKELGYVREDKKSKISFKVPVFQANDISILKEISNCILCIIENEIDNTFKKLNNDYKELSAIKHKVDIKEIANELWHQVFGSINEYLVEKNFFERPNYIDGQGRFFQSIYIEE